MKNLFFYLIVTITLLSSQACHRNIYVPNAQNVSLFQEKGEVQANVGYSNLQVSYAVDENIGLMLNSQYTLGDKTATYVDIFEDTPSKRNIIEIGAGYFNSTNDNDWTFEVYGGAGIGEIEFKPRQDLSQDYFSAKHSRLFLQPAIGFSKNLIDFAFSMRLSHLNYYDLNTNNYQYDPDASMLEHDLSQLDNSRYTFVEPALTLRIGWKYVKLHTQMVIPYQIGGLDINHMANINVGIHINIAKRFKKTTTNLSI